MIRENKYFSVIKNKSNDFQSLDIHRKRPTLPNSFVELLEVLAEFLTEKETTYLFIPTNDQYLLQDLQCIGFVLKGYLIESDDGYSSLLWDSSKNEKIIDLTDITQIKNNKVRRICLSLGEKVEHPISLGSYENIEFIRQRDRFLNGLSTFSYIPTNQEDSVRNNNYENKKEKRVRSDFDEIILNRKSESNFKKPISNEQISLLLNDSFSYISSFQKVYPCAGGFGDFTPLIIQNDENVSKFEIEKNKLVSTDIKLNSDSIYELAGEMETFQNCSSWIVITSNLERTVEKYGTRGYRFVLIETGAIVQQLHLSASSFDLSIRVFGGFDDRLLEKMLNLPEREIVTCIIGVGSK